MVSTPSDNDAQAAHAPPPPRSSYSTPTGAPNPSWSDLQSANTYTPPGGASLGQQPYSSPPPPPQGGAYPQYSSYAPQGYPQAYPGAYGYPGYLPPGVPGYPTPADQYAPQYTPPPSGQYVPPPGQYAPPPGQYPPPLGQHPPPTGVPPAGQYPGASPAGKYPPPGGAYQMSGQSSYQPGYYLASPFANQPLRYLGTAIPDPHAPPAPLGVQKVPGYDPAVTFNHVMKAINSAHNTQLYTALLPLDVFKMDALRDYTIAKTGKSLPDHIEHYGLMGNSFSVALRALTLGPLGFDVDLVHKALVGLGTNEMMLTELILGRSGNEIQLLIEGYRLRYGKDLVNVVKNDLSGKTERMFIMALGGQRPPDHLPLDHAQVATDIETLHHASKKKEEVPFFEVLINRSNPHIAAVTTGFAMRYKSLSKVIKKTFSGHLEASLLYIVHGAKPKRDGQGFWRDAKLLEKSMTGLGTRDTQLIYRLVRAHWDPNRLAAIKDAYKRRYGKPLEGRVKGETSGDYQKLLVAIVKSNE